MCVKSPDHLCRLHILVTTYFYIHTYTYIYIHIDTYTDIHIHIYTYIYIHTYTYIRICTYTYIHIHTYPSHHIHTHTAAWLAKRVKRQLHTYQLLMTPTTHIAHGSLLFHKRNPSYKSLWTKLSPFWHIWGIASMTPTTHTTRGYLLWSHWTDINILACNSSTTHTARASHLWLLRLIRLQ